MKKILSKIDGSLEKLAAFCDGAATVLSIRESLSGEKNPEIWQKKISLWRRGIFRIVVMGECNKGKSSFINALLGTPGLLPVSSGTATSTIFKISYGERAAYRVFFTLESGKEPLEIAAGELASYGTEDGNPGNEKNVAFIHVTYPSLILKDGLVIIDTPGLGGVFSDHKRITYEYVPRSDAVFLVTESSGSPLGDAEMSLLDDLKKVTNNIYFVQTKARLVDKDAREARMHNNLDILSNSERSALRGDKDIKYFVVDSEQKKQADATGEEKPLIRSGFPDVLRFLDEELRPQIAELIMERAAMELLPEVMYVQRIISDKLKILKARDEAERARILEELKKAKELARKWETEVKPRLMNDLNTDLLDLKQEVKQQYHKLDVGSGAALGEKIRNDLNSAPNGNALDNLFGTESVELTKSINDVFQVIIKLIKEGLNDSLKKTYSAVQREMIADGEIGAGQDVVIDISPCDPKDWKRMKGWDKARQHYYGQFAGAGIGGIVGSVIGGTIGALAGLYVGDPIDGAVLGAQAGSFICTPVGMRQAFSHTKSGILNADKQNAILLLENWVRQNVQRNNENVTFWFDRQKLVFDQRFTAAIKSYNDELEKRIKELEQAAKSGGVGEGELKILIEQNQKFAKSVLAMGFVKDEQPKAK